MIECIPPPPSFLLHGSDLRLHVSPQNTQCNLKSNEDKSLNDIIVFVVAHLLAPLYQPDVVCGIFKCMRKHSFYGTRWYKLNLHPGGIEDFHIGCHHADDWQQ